MQPFWKARLSQLTPIRRTGLVMVPVVVLLAFTYVAYEIQALSSSERAIADIYDQQLETLLYSINQNAWDVANAWAGEIENALIQGEPGSIGSIERLQEVVHQTSPFESLFLADSTLSGGVLITDSTFENITRIDWYRDNSAAFKKTATELLRLKRSGFRKLSPIWMKAPDGSTHVSLLFTPSGAGRQTAIAGMMLDNDAFIQHVLAPKLREIGRESFTVILARKGSDDFILATGPTSETDARQWRDVWVLPDYRVGIDPRTSEIENILRRRFYRSLALIFLLASVLAIGTWQVVRNARQEIRLAAIKSDFVSNVSHELRTPLALIRMYAETLEMGRVPSETRRLEYYGIIRQETERLSRLVNNILNFSRLEAGKKHFNMAHADLNQRVENVIRIYGPGIEKQEFTLSVHLGSLPPILLDAEAIEEALINLLDNAVKYSRDVKQIEVKTGKEGANRVYVEVADKGIGIPREEQARVFEQFHRAESALVHDTKGSGLGLTLVRRIVEAHHGVIKIDSNPGAGSRFRIILPIQHPESSKSIT